MRQPNYTSLFLAAAVVLVGQRAEAQTNVTAGNLAGSVLFNGAPISGNGLAPIYLVTEPLGNPTAWTNSSGGYEFDNLPTGSIGLNAFANSGEDSDALLGTFNTTVVGGATTSFNLDITQTAGEVVGSITVNGAPQTVMVGLTSKVGDVNIYNRATNTDSSGRFARFFPAGSYTMGIYSLSSALLGTFTFTISNGQVATPQPVNVQTGNVSGSVVFNGSPISGNGLAPIYLVSEPSGNPTQWTNSNGAYEFDNLTVGTFELAAFANSGEDSDAAMGTFTTTVVGGSNPSFNLDITSYAGEVVGSILVNGVAETVMVGLTSKVGDPNIYDRATNTDSNGRFSRFYPPGSYTMGVYSLESSLLGTFSFTIAAGAVTSLNPINEQTGNVAGSVLFNGTPISGNGLAPIYLVSKPSGNPTQWTNSSGGYEFDNLLAGPFELAAFANSGEDSDAAMGTFNTTVVGGVTTPFNLDIAPYAGEVIGTITVNGVPETVMVGLTSKVGNPNIYDRATDTDSSGRFSRFYPPGDYTMGVYSLEISLARHL